PVAVHLRAGIGPCSAWKTAKQEKAQLRLEHASPYLSDPMGIGVCTMIGSICGKWPPSPGTEDSRLRTGRAARPVGTRLPARLPARPAATPVDLVRRRSLQRHARTPAVVPLHEVKHFPAKPLTPQRNRTP